MKTGPKLCIFAAMRLAAGVDAPIGLSALGGCSSAIPPGHDGGTAAATEAGDEAGLDAAGGARCQPLVGRLCGRGETCCISGIVGTCVASGTCRSEVQASCLSRSDCDDGVCCGSIQLPTRVATSTLDASHGLPGYEVPGFGLTLECTTACAAPAFELCRGPQDCPPGQACKGGPSGPGLGLLMACSPLEGTPPPAGTGDAIAPGDGSP